MDEENIKFVWIIPAICSSDNLSTWEQKDARECHFQTNYARKRKYRQRQTSFKVSKANIFNADW